MWSFRYYTEENGRSVYKRKIIGTVAEFPRRKDAERALAQVRVNINEGAAFAPMTVEKLAIHFLKMEAPLKAFATQEGYKNIITNRVIPYWPDMLLKRHIRPAAIAAGISKKIGWHTFRRTTATLLLSIGASIRVTQELLRHASPVMTLGTYSQAISADKIDAQTALASHLGLGAVERNKAASV